MSSQVEVTTFLEFKQEKQNPEKEEEEKNNRYARQPLETILRTHETNLIKSLLIGLKIAVTDP